jgi:site-specific recombinase XerD
MQHLLRLADNTIDAYGRSLEDYLSFCSRLGVAPEAAGADHVALWVHDLASRPNPHGAKVLSIDSGFGLSNATMQLRLTVVRLYYDHLMEQGVRGTNPVGRGRYTPGKAFAGKRDRGLLRRYRRLPWIPGDAEWARVLRAASQEPLRNRAMLLLAYDGALRREELVRLGVEDLDFPHALVQVRAEVAKNGVARVVCFSSATAGLLAAYHRRRRALSAGTGPLFLSESRRNLGEPLTPSAWSKVVRGIAKRADIPRFTTHTLRHLRLTHLARAGWDIHEIATYAGHRSLRSTALYIHLSGRDLAEKVRETWGWTEDLLPDRYGDARGEAGLRSEAEEV